MATCSQQVSGNFISLPSGSSHGERVGSLGPPFRVRESRLEEEGCGLVEWVYLSTVPSVSWTTAVWRSGFVQRVRTVPGRGRQWLQCEQTRVHDHIHT